MPPRRVGRGCLPRRYVDEQELPYAPGVQDQGEVSNAEFREAFRILSQVVTNQIDQQRGARHERADTSRIREFLGMNPPNFMGSSTTEDPENFIEEFKKKLSGIEKEIDYNSNFDVTRRYSRFCGVL